jgi:hypothetical protein
MEKVGGVFVFPPKNEKEGLGSRFAKWLICPRRFGKRDKVQ